MEYNILKLETIDQNNDKQVSSIFNRQTIINEKKEQKENLIEQINSKEKEVIKKESENKTNILDENINKSEKINNKEEKEQENEINNNKFILNNTINNFNYIFNILKNYYYYIFAILILLISFILRKFNSFNSINKEQKYFFEIRDDCIELNENIKKEWEEWEKIQENNEKEFKEKISNNRVIIGIDFGSSFSGFTFIIDLENKINTSIDIRQLEIRENYIEPTTIIFKKNSTKRFEWGNGAEKFMKKSIKNKNDYIYFNRIKTNLDPKFILQIENEIYIEAEKPKGFKILLKQVISEYLKAISDKALKSVNYKGHKYEKSDIKWVVTVPAIWDEYGKQFMKKCSKKAGMNDIDIALEPEAASLTMFNDTNIDEKYKKKGKVFMLVDAGGYTVDITLNKIIDDFGNLQQLSPPSGGSYGSTNINKNIADLISEIIPEKVSKLKEKNYEDWKEILDVIEDKKINFYADDASDSSIIKIKTRPDFIECDKKNSNKKCTKKTKYGIIEFDNYNFYISNKIMEKIIYNSVTPIITHLKELYKKYNQTKIDMLVLTGGFSNCDILKNEIEKNFENVHILMKPEYSVMKGAVLYKIYPNQIVSRKMPYTFGIESYISLKNITSNEKECKKQVIEDDEIYCSYFTIFKNIDDDIKNNESIKRIFTPLGMNQTEGTINIFYEDFRDPTYINENKKLASFKIDVKETYLPKEKRIVEITMIFGSSITVIAKNTISGKNVRITTNYYQRKDDDS